MVIAQYKIKQNCPKVGTSSSVQYSTRFENLVSVSDPSFIRGFDNDDKFPQVLVSSFSFGLVYINM